MASQMSFVLGLEVHDGTVYWLGRPQSGPLLLGAATAERPCVGGSELCIHLLVTPGGGAAGGGYVGRRSIVATPRYLFLVADEALLRTDRQTFEGIVTLAQPGYESALAEGTTLFPWRRDGTVHRIESAAGNASSFVEPEPGAEIRAATLTTTGVVLAIWFQNSLTVRRFDRNLPTVRGITEGTSLLAVEEGPAPYLLAAHGEAVFFARNRRRPRRPRPLAIHPGRQVPLRHPVSRGDALRARPRALAQGGVKALSRWGRRGRSTLGSGRSPLA